MILTQGPLLEALYIPPVFAVASKDAQKSERVRFFSSTRGEKESPKQLKVLLGEVKDIGKLRHSYVMTILDMPDAQLILPDDLHRRMIKNFEDILSLWEANPDSHLIVLCTLGLGISGLLMVDELTLMMVDSRWLPYSNVEELELLNKLVSDGRTFSKPLRCNLQKDMPIASATLQDTGKDLFDLYILLHDGVTKEALEKFITESAGQPVGDAWIWNTTEGVMPPLPTKSVNHYARIKS